MDHVRNEMIDKERIAVVEERLNELKDQYKESARKNWSLGTAIAGGVIGAIVAILGQLLLSVLRK
jgi:hypothetical protein